MVDCSLTRVIADWMILLYSNCVAVQTSNKFLSHTTMALFDVLDHDDSAAVTIDECNSPVIPVDSDKEWCFVKKNIL